VQDSGQELGCRIDAYIDGVGSRSDGAGVVDGSGDGVGSSEGVAEGAGVMGYEICGVGRGLALKRH
jgi:hypothetical protein